VGMQIMLWKECLDHWNSHEKDVSKMTWKDVDDYMMDYTKQNLSVYPIVLWMRLCNLLNMLRASPRVGKRGDFELYRQCTRLANCLFAITNATSYVRTTLDERISLETCNKIDYLIRKCLCFTALSARGNPCAMDIFQEGLARIERQLALDGGSKKWNLLTERELRARFQNADYLRTVMKNVLTEMKAELVMEVEQEESTRLVSQKEEAENAAFEKENIDRMVETYEGEKEDKRREELDDQNQFRPHLSDPTRHRKPSASLIATIQWAQRHNIFSSSKPLVDSNMAIIPNGSFLSLVDSKARGKQPHLSMLEALLVGQERL